MENGTGTGSGNHNSKLGNVCRLPVHPAHFNLMHENTAAQIAEITAECIAWETCTQDYTSTSQHLQAVEFWPLTSNLSFPTKHYRCGEIFRPGLVSSCFDFLVALFRCFLVPLPEKNPICFFDSFNILLWDALSIFCPSTINRQVIKTYHAELQPQATAGKLRFQPSSSSLWLEFLPWTPMGMDHQENTARTEQSPCKSTTPALNSTKHAGWHWWHWQLVLMLMMLTSEWTLQCESSVF